MKGIVMDCRTDAWQELGFPGREACEFPNIVNVEVFRGVCPCRCVHCPVGTTPPERRPARFGQAGIDLALFDKITAEVGRHPWATVRLHSVGDPIVWDGLVEALRIVSRNRVRAWVFTSLVTRDEALLDALCQHPTIVEVSVNSTSATDYRNTKGTDDYDLVVANLRAMRQRAVGARPVRLLATRVQSLDPAADEQFVRHWRLSGLVDDAFVRSYHTYNDCLPQRAGLGQPGHQPCLVHWARFNIDVEGRAVVCFNELFKEWLDPALVLGDVREQTIAEIWHGPKLSSVRKAELTGDYSSPPFLRSLPCKTCTSCQPLGGGRQTSEHQVSALQ